MEIRTVADIRRNSGWRQALEEHQNYERERREREQAQAKAREVEQKPQAATDNSAEAWWTAIDERIRWWFDFYFSGRGKGNNQRGLYADAIGGAMGKIRAQLREEFEQALEEERRSFEAKLAEQRERFLASNNQAAWVSWVDDRIKATFGYGRDVLLEEVRRVVEGAQRLLEAKLVALEERVKAGLPSKFPIAKAYRLDTVHYSGDVVTHAGATYQATCDTCREPPHDVDWVRIACAGRDGYDGHTPNFCGRYDAYQKYQQFDVIEFDGSSYIAVRDLDRGTLPGEDGWQLLCRSGSRGPAGEVGPRGRKGERGARGEDGREIVSWYLERATYRVFPVFADGKMGPELNLRGLFEQFVEENELGRGIILMATRGSPVAWDDFYKTARWQRLRKFQLIQHPLCKFSGESRMR